MPEEQKIVLDVAAGMAPDIVAVITGLYILVRLWETQTVKRLTGRD